MSFKTNDCQQISINDAFNNLTAREQKALKNSWAHVFAEEVFPAIDEKRFAVLYSDKASRPNTPVNITIGAMIIKELFDYSDDEIVENLMLDLHLQYALHTTSFEEQPLSDKTLSRFRKRCYEYETLHGVDLYRECVKDLSEKIAKMMKINGRIRRMDSMMIEANIRKLSRLELVYTCISKLVCYLNKNIPELVTDELKHYAEADDFNKIFYHHRNDDADKTMETLLEDSNALIEICSNQCEGITEYDLFVRCISEQTVVENGERRFCTKEDKQLNSKTMQNPSDPEATCRIKSGKVHRGYVANVEETVGKSGSIITDYQYEANIYSDSQFIKDRIEELSEQEENTVLITDGAYFSDENIHLAKEKNIELITTGLTGADAKDILNEFEYNEDKTKVIRCPAGHQPRSSCFISTDQKIKTSFERTMCENCPHRDECKPQFHKFVAKVFIYQKSIIRAELQRTITSEKYANYIRLRNGVETIPSNIRRNYHLDKLPRGKQRGKFFFGNKIAAFNFRKLFNYRRGFGNYALNPLLT